MRTMRTRRVPLTMARTACVVRLESSRRQTDDWRAMNAPVGSLWRRNTIARCVTAALRLTRIRYALMIPKVYLASHVVGRYRWTVHHRNGAPSVHARNRVARASRHGRAHRCASRPSLAGAVYATKVRAQPHGVAVRHAVHSSGAKHRTAILTSAQLTALCRTGRAGIRVTRNVVKAPRGVRVP